MTDSPEREQNDAATTAEATEKTERLNLEVKIENRSTCERHITVTVPHDDVTRYFDKEFSDLMPEAHLPGFRPGHAPRKLVETRFRKEVSGKVKSALLMDSIAQIHDENKIAAISEPDLNLDAVKVPDEGPMTFEFNLEVRPEFTMPNWKGLKIEKPVREISDADVTSTLERVLANRGRLIPFDGAAEPGDYVTVNLTFKHGDEVISSAKEEVIRIRPTLSFRDGKVEKFDALLKGVRGGETREGEATVSKESSRPDLQGQKIKAIFEVLEVKKLEVPELTPELLEELGSFGTEADLRDAIKDQLGRQLDYEQRRRARQQITAALTESADWELPQGLLQRQSRRELERMIMELQRSGFTEDQIRTHANELRQNSTTATATALKEHFILERIAEDENIDAVEEDYDNEIMLIAYQSGESPRRVRARLEKSGNMDVLRNQIVERKVIDVILAKAEFKEVPFSFETTDSEAVDQNVTGETGEDIPEAKVDEDQLAVKKEQEKEKK